MGNYEFAFPFYQNSAREQNGLENRAESQRRESSVVLRYSGRWADNEQIIL